MRIILNDVMDWDNFFYVSPNKSGSFWWLNSFYNNRFLGAIRRRIGIPWRKESFAHYVDCSEKLGREDDIVFLFVRHEPWFFGETGFLKYLRNTYVNAKLVYLLINVNQYLQIDFETFIPYFDKVITIDEGDAQKYKITFHPFFYSAVDLYDESIPESDCFYVGNAKKRLVDILDTYEWLTKQGIKCDFHLIGVPKEKQKYEDHIIYNKPMSYNEVVCRVKKSKILLEIMQEGQTSGTLREHEAVAYGKKLLTNNKYIVSRSFYNDENILVFEKCEDIKKDFIFNNNEIIYPNRNDISPSVFLRWIDNEV